MRTVWLCADCSIVAVSEDWSVLDGSHAVATIDDAVTSVQEGLERLGWLTPTEPGESSDDCDCCGASGCSFNVLEMPGHYFETGEAS
jgi:hypothetical protein